MTPEWHNIKEIRPRKSGFYLYLHNPGVGCSMFYYDKSLDYVMDIDCGEYWVGTPANKCTGLFWAKLPKISKSKFLSQGYLRIAL